MDNNINYYSNEDNFNNKEQSPTNNYINNLENNNNDEENIYKEGYSNNLKNNDENNNLSEVEQHYFYPKTQINDLEDEFDNNYNNENSVNENYYVKMNNNIGNNDINPEYFNSNLNFNYTDEEEFNINKNNNNNFEKNKNITNKDKISKKNEKDGESKWSNLPEEENIISYGKNEDNNNNMFYKTEKNKKINLNNNNLLIQKRIEEVKKNELPPSLINFSSDWKNLPQGEQKIIGKYSKEPNEEKDYSKKEIINENIERKISDINYQPNMDEIQFDMFNNPNQDIENINENKNYNFNPLSVDKYKFESKFNKINSEFKNNQINKDFMNNKTNKKGITNKENYLNNNNDYLFDNKNNDNIINNNIINSNIINNNIKKLNDIIIELKEENINLKSQNQILNVSLIQKEQIIEFLNNKINELQNNDDYINTSLNEEENLKDEIEKLQIEKDELFNQNQKLTLGINSFNERLKEINEIYNKKNEAFINEINSYKTKLLEYKKKIIILKIKIDELYNIKSGERGMIPIYSNMENNEYDKAFFKYKNLTPDRLMNKNRNKIRKKKNETKDFREYNLGEKEDTLQKEQKQFVKNYREFLEKLGK